jgi:hypothetical protein
VSAARLVALVVDATTRRAHRVLPLGAEEIPAVLASPVLDVERLTPREADRRLREDHA